MTKLIHVAKIQHPEERLLLLRRTDLYRFVWYREDRPGIEIETAIWGGTTEEAIRQAYKQWRFDRLQTIHCGFRYTLPERDEVGSNALFYQMVSSYSSMTGVYFDEELNLNCIVQNAPSESRALWKRLQASGQC